MFAEENCPIAIKCHSGGNGKEGMTVERFESCNRTLCGIGASKKLDATAKLSPVEDANVMEAMVRKGPEALVSNDLLQFGVE